MSRFVGLVLTISACALAVGCKSVPQADYDAAIEENSQLRERVSTLQSRLEDSNNAQSNLATENQRLASELSQRQAQPAFGAGSETRTGGSSGQVVITLASDVLFAPGQATLKSSARAQLDRVAQTINRDYRNRMVRVEGYTDGDPIRRSKWESNEHLSAARALAVEKYLISQGVDNNRIYSAAFGPSAPRNTKEQSRRVEIVILSN